MSDIQAAAERLKRCRNGEDTEDVYGHDCDVSSWGNSAIQMAQQDEDAYRVADAYLAELDHAPVDREWLESLGFSCGNTDRDGVRWFVGPSQIELSFDVGGFRNLYLDQQFIATDPTRGQVRTLLRLLG